MRRARGLNACRSVVSATTWCDRSPTEPFDPNTVNKHTRAAWTTARRREDAEGLVPERERIRPIGLHECRHTAVSHMLDARQRPQPTASDRWDVVAEGSKAC